MPMSPGLTGAWGAEEWGRTLIEALATEAVLLRAGAHRIDVVGREIHVPRMLVNPRADWVEELRELPSDEGEADTLDLKPQKLGNVVSLSTESIQDSSTETLDGVGRAMVRGVATQLDAKAFSSDRAAEGRSPAGLFLAELRVPGARTRAVTIRSLVTAVGTIVAAGGVPNAIIVAPVDLTALRLEALESAYATLARPEEPGIERVAGAALYATPALSRNEVVVADMNYVTVAVRRDARVDFSPDAGFSTDSVMARVTMRVDFGWHDVNAGYILQPEE